MSRNNNITRNTSLPPRAPSSSSLSSSLSSSSSLSRMSKKKSYLGRGRDSSGIKSRKASIKAAMNSHLDGCQSEHIPRTLPSSSPLDDFNSSWGDLELDAPRPQKPCSWMNLDLEESFASFASEETKSSNTSPRKAYPKKKSLSSSSKRRKQKSTKPAAQKRAVGASAA